MECRLYQKYFLPYVNLYIKYIKLVNIRENISAWSGKREQWREKRSSSSSQFPLVLFSCLRLFYFAELTISEPGTGHLFLSLWPEGDDGNFSTCTENFWLLKQTLIKHQTLFQCIKTAIVFWLPWKHWLRMDFVILWTYIHHKKRELFH